MNARLTALTERLMDMFKELTPSGEIELANKVREKGGAQAVRENDASLRELSEFETTSVDGKRIPKGGAVKDANEHTPKTLGVKPQADKRATSRSTLQDLKDELREDWDTAVSHNMEIFEGKFALHQRQLQEELSRVIREENNRVIDEVNKGPHDLIKHPVCFHSLRDIRDESLNV